MQRPDRDNFIEVHLDALKDPSLEVAFDKYDQADLSLSQYDISSVMHYAGTVGF